MMSVGPSRSRRNKQCAFVKNVIIKCIISHMNVLGALNEEMKSPKGYTPYK